MSDERTLRCGPELSFGGEAIAAIDGRTVFVRGGIPGELVRVSSMGKRKGYEIFDVVEVLEASPLRREAKCKHFGECGGCILQHMSYDAQLDAKLSVLAHALRIPKEDFVVRRSEEYGYRARVRLVAKGRSFGYRRPRSHEILEFEECPILSPSLEAALLAYRERLQQTAIAAPPAEFELLEGDTRIAAAPPLPGFALDDVEITSRGAALVAGADAFFQANRSALEDFVAHVLELAGEGDLALDLYCGVGLFSFALAERFARVIGVEGSQVACAHAQQALQRRQVQGLSFHAYDTEQWLVAYADRVARGAAAKPDLVVLDPPRSGAKDVLEALRRLGAPKVIYVSCDPQTLGRDLETLRNPDAPGTCYDLGTATLFDLFPQTYHMESVLSLHARDSLKARDLRI